MPSNQIEFPSLALRAATISFQLQSAIPIFSSLPNPHPPLLMLNGEISQGENSLILIMFHPDSADLYRKRSTYQNGATATGTVHLMRRSVCKTLVSPQSFHNIYRFLMSCNGLSAPTLINIPTIPHCISEFISWDLCLLHQNYFTKLAHVHRFACRSTSVSNVCGGLIAIFWLDCR